MSAAIVGLSATSRFCFDGAFCGLDDPLQDKGRHVMAARSVIVAYIGTGRPDGCADKTDASLSESRNLNNRSRWGMSGIGWRSIQC